MRPSIFICALACPFGLSAQTPPIDVDWMDIKWYGSGPSESHMMLCFDGPRTGWLLDHNPTPGPSVYQDGFVKYSGPGLQTSYLPLGLACGNSGSVLSVVLRNDSVFRLASRFLSSGGQTVYCLSKPGGSVQVSTLPSGAITNVYGRDLLLDTEGIHVTASSDSIYNSSAPKHQRLMTWSPGGTLLWDTIYPTQQFRHFSSIVRHNGLLAVADFPFIHWFAPSNGDLVSSLQVHPGTEGIGDLEVHEGELFWASSVGNTMYYGKLDAFGNMLWSESLDGGVPRSIAVDDQHRLWIAPGSTITPGTIYRVSPGGSVVEPFFYGTDVRSVICQQGKIAMAGKWNATSDRSFIVVGTPQP